MNKIRPTSLLIVRSKDKLFVYKVNDKIKKEEFYRLLGGGIEFGETAEDALRREIKEEIGAGIKNIRLLDVKENIYTFEGEAGHEIVFIFEAKFKDKEFYNKNNLEVKDRKKGRKAVWVEIKELRKSRFYPEGVIDLI